jgi:hypothetical protein
MILQMAILGAGVPGMGDIRGVPGITGTRVALSIGLRGHRQQAAGLDLSPRPIPDWIKVKNPKAPAVRREAEEDWGR